MAFLEIPRVAVEGVAACVPAQKRSYDDYRHLFSEQEFAQFSEATGIRSSRVSTTGACTSDLCFAAAERLLGDLQIDRREIDLLLFVSQTPDYIVPMTSCLLQERLGLPVECAALDLTAGCSGYPYGLSVAASMLAGGNLRRCLLLVGDSPSQISPLDKSTYPLFGAAGSATLLRYDPLAGGMQFHLATDGSGAEAIMAKAGGMRHPITPASFEMKEYGPKIVRNEAHLILNGMDVFSFAIAEVPESIEKLYAHFGLHREQTDYFVFHQANRMILENIAELLELPAEKVPVSLGEFANTSSASIPLTLVTEVGSLEKDTDLCLCGFGVGLSWGSCHFRTSRLYCSPLVEYA